MGRMHSDGSSYKDGASLHDKGRNWHVTGVGFFNTRKAGMRSGLHDLVEVIIKCTLYLPNKFTS
jgi:hypothetical protein